jgi:chromosome segregation ATPase
MGEQMLDIATTVEELQGVKDRISGNIERFIELMQGIAERTNVNQKELQDAQWFLGEERARREALENTLKDCEERCRAKEEKMAQLWAHCEALQKQLQDTQWYLGEERARRQQLENQPCK